MTRFDPRSPIGGPPIVPRQTPRPLGPVPQIESPGLSAPGVAPAPVDLSSVASASDTIQALGLVGEAANAVGSFYQTSLDRQMQQDAELQREAERLANQNDSIARQYDATLKGDGALSAAIDLPELLSKIERGEGPFARDPSLTPGQQTMQVVSAITEGFPQPTADGYKRVALDKISAAYQRADDAARADMDGLMLESASSLAVVAGDTNELRSAFDAARSVKGVSELSAVQHTYLLALRSAARAGDAAKFSMIEAAMPPVFQAERAEARAQLENAEIRRRAALEGEAGTRIAERLLAGEPFELLRDAVKSDPNLDANAKLRFLSQMDVAEAQRVREAQSLNANSLQVSIGLGRWYTDARGNPSPTATANEVIRRMDLSASDPKHLSADTGLGLLSRIDRQMETDQRLGRIGELFSLTNTPPAATDPSGAGAGAGASRLIPLTPRDDDALIRFYSMQRIVRARPDSSGNAILDGITDPLRLATSTAIAKRLPADLSNSIAAGLASSDSAQFRAAASAFGALSRFAPDQARSIDLQGLGAMRAHFIASRVDRLGADAFLNPSAWESNSGQIAAQAEKLNPDTLNLTSAQIAGAVFFGDSSSTRGRDEARVTTAARDAFTAAFKESPAWKDRASRDQTTLGFGGASIDSIPAEVVGEYRANLEAEYRAAKSFMPNESSAAAAARTWAFDRTIKRYPPLTWGGRVYFTNAPGTPSDSSVETLIENDLRTPPDGVERTPEFDSARQGIIDDLRNNYIPVWRQDQRGFVFVSKADPFSLYTLWTRDAVAPLVVDPFVPPLQAKAKEIRDAIDARRAKRANQAVQP